MSKPGTMPGSAPWIAQPINEDANLAYEILGDNGSSLVGWASGFETYEGADEKTREHAALLAAAPVLRNAVHALLSRFADRASGAEDAAAVARARDALRDANTLPEPVAGYDPA